jgi:integrase
MARSSYQRGCLQWHQGQWTLLYRVREAGKMVQRREVEAFKQFTDRNDKKAAKRAAEPFMEQINARNNNPKFAVSDSPITFAQFIKTRWASYVSKRNMEPSTVASYDSIIKAHLLPVFGDVPLSQITPGCLTYFFDKLSGKAKPKTVSNVYGLLNTMLDVALDYEIIENKPLRKKLHKPEVEKEEKPVLKPEEVRQILAKLPPAHRLFIAVLSILTVRAGEGLALRWLNVDFENRTLSLTHSIWRGKLKATLKTKGSKRRFILPASLIEALVVHRAQSAFNRDEDFIFPNAVGGPLEPGNFRKRVLYPVMDELKIKREDRQYGFHLLRHTAATVLHEQTGDIEVAQRALGHARRSTTEDVYDHAERILDEETISLLVEDIIGDANILHSEAIN